MVADARATSTPTEPSGTPLISVVLPTYNRARTLGAAARSVLEQTYRNLELIIVDDGSTDETEAVVRELGDTRVRYVRRTNGGPGAARNTGIAAALAEWIAFQDSDDRWLPGKLALQVARIAAAPADVGVILCGHRDQRPERTYEHVVDEFMARGDARRSLLTGLHYITPTWLVRKSALSRSGGFDEALPSCEDHDLAFRLSDVCRFECVPEVLVVKHFNVDSVYNSPASRAEGFGRVLRRHHSRWRNEPHWLARHEFLLGYWYLKELKQTARGLYYLWRASRHDPVAQRTAVREQVVMHFWPALPDRVRARLWRHASVRRFLARFDRRDPTKRPVARVFTPAPLDPLFPNGFSGRWFHFVRALTRDFDVEVVAVRGIWHGPLPDEAFRPPTPVARFGVLDAVPFPRVPTLWLFLLARLLANLNTRRVGPVVRNVETALAPAPDIAVFLTHYLGHYAFRMPQTPAVFVLEEGLVRTLHRNVAPAVTLVHARVAWRHTMQWLAERRYRKVVKRFGRRGPIVAISDEERRWFAALMPRAHIGVVPNGVDPEEYAPRPPQPDHDVAIFGDLAQARTYVPAAELIAAARRRDDARHLRWLLVGREPAPALQALAGATVTLTGTVADTRPYYPRVRIVVVPARIVTGSKSTILKAWAMQRPVVTTPEGTSGIPGRPGENLLVGATADAILDAVLGLLREPQRADALAAAGRRSVVQDCNLNRQAEEFAQLCRALVRPDENAAVPARTVANE